jgi:NRAMP (natural resistance-associated macrophage protein)-like metal ion transporter
MNHHGSAAAETSQGPEPSTRKEPKVRLRDIVGPGLITGASDDDPSGIATYSQAGAAFGYGLGWTMVFTYPLMSVVQMISARIGRTTGHGIAGNLRRHYPHWLAWSVVTFLLIANTINIGADLGAMADATALVTGIPGPLFLLLFAAFCALSEVFMRYGNYVRVLKWLTLALFAYVITLFLVQVPWGEALGTMVLPQIEPGSAPLILIVAILGTTISPYLFFWQAEEEAEDVKEFEDRQPLKCAPEDGRYELKRIELDTLAGMAASNLVAIAIIWTAAATLNANGITDIDSSAKAAAALEPIAGSYASTIFALGIVGTGLLAIPVLAGSAAYAVGEALRWPVGLARKPRRAKAFYATIVAATAIGALMNFTPIKPIQALYWAAVINGVVAVPVMAVMMLMSRRKSIMGVFTITPGMAVVGWVATAAMGLAVIAMFWSMLAAA